MTKTIETSAGAVADDYTADMWAERCSEIDREISAIMSQKAGLNEKLAGTNDWELVQDLIDELGIASSESERLHQLRKIAEQRGQAAMQRESAEKKGADAERAVPILDNAREAAARIDGLLEAMAIELQSLRNAAQDLFGLSQSPNALRVFLRNSATINAAMTFAGLDEYAIYPRIHGRSLESNFEMDRRIQSPPERVMLEPTPAPMNALSPVRKVEPGWIAKTSAESAKYRSGLPGGDEDTRPPLNRPLSETSVAPLAGQHASPKRSRRHATDIPVTA